MLHNLFQFQVFGCNSYLWRELNNTELAASFGKISFINKTALKVAWRKFLQISKTNDRNCLQLTWRSYDNLGWPQIQPPVWSQVSSEISRLFSAIRSWKLQGTEIFITLYAIVEFILHGSIFTCWADTLPVSSHKRIAECNAQTIGNSPDFQFLTWREEGGSRL